MNKYRQYLRRLGNEHIVISIKNQNDKPFDKSYMFQ